MNQIFVRFVPSWEVDPEPVVVKEPDLEEKEALYDKMLSRAIDIGAGSWVAESNTLFVFEGDVFIGCLNSGSNGDYIHLLKIDKRFSKYFPDEIEQMEPNSFVAFQRRLFDSWARWERSAGKEYLSLSGSPNFRIGKVYPNTGFVRNRY